MCWSSVITNFLQDEVESFSDTEIFAHGDGYYEEDRIIVFK